ncbi:putative transcription factor CP2B [Danaus plexippus plexippus]|uniref:Transcription factor CP2B n=1 Tax=Danaus plexippus plexippus TaxID=278856 RepID=A0A212FKF4_DANPL|nr:putative transcription factor CP2B [Danaus plexippus plexippus]
MANLDLGGSGTSSSSSHLSPGWQVNDLDLDLPGELSMNEALLSLPSLAVFKQEAPSPTGNALSPPRRTWPVRRTDDRQITNMVVDNRDAMDEGCQQHAGVMNTQSNSPESMQCQTMPVIMPINGYHSPSGQENKSNEALLSLPSLAVFKQEAPSPTGNALSPPRRTWPVRRTDDRQITNMVVDNRDAMDEGCQQHAGVMNTQSNSPESMQCQTMPVIMPINGYHSPSGQENKNAGLLMCSPASSLDGFLHSPRPDSGFKDDNRFQYVLAAATSIATKQNEETLTYLNQGQPYEVKLKKLGDLAHYKGKILKSIIKICFHERRLQYMEREQIAQWHNDRPGERILEVDVPLSYGVSRVEQPAALNELHVHWDPTKDVGVYVKVNCISTEFTAKKHGGEKGVPFRIQVETMYEDRRLHTAACQIKVFKLKGADRKHKQDRERVLRRPRSEVERYQPGCDATVLTTLSNDALMPPPSLVTTSPPYSPEMW